jgi:hypothetical protein
LSTAIWPPATWLFTKPPPPPTAPPALSFDADGVDALEPTGEFVRNVPAPLIFTVDESN